MRLRNSISCYLQLLKEFDNLFREINVYAKSYTMMYELEIKEGKMYFTRKIYDDKHRYNEASCNEVAVIATRRP